MSKRPIASASSRSFAIHDGTLMGWGKDDLGYIGTGLAATSSRSTPTAVAGFGSASTNPAARIVAISSTYLHALAVTASGQVYAWGSNSNGQLGNGTTVDRPTNAAPLLLTGLSNIIAVAAGRRHSMALDSSGHVYVWGANMYGQLGLGHTNPVTTPTLNPNLSNVTVIGNGWDHSFATTQSGASYGWGSNGNGQLGVGVSGSFLSTPTALSGTTGFKQFSGGADFTLALDNTGRAWAFGRDLNGQLGDSPTWSDRNVPTLVSGFSGLTMVSVAAGERHSLAIDSLGRVYAWGANTYGERGDSDTADHFVPVRISSIRDFIVEIAAGPFHSMAADSNGQLFAWGNNSSGQFGTGAVGGSIVSTPTKSLYVFTYKVLVIMWSLTEENYSGLQTEMARLAEDIARIEGHADSAARQRGLYGRAPPGGSDILRAGWARTPRDEHHRDVSDGRGVHDQLRATGRPWGRIPFASAAEHAAAARGRRRGFRRLLREKPHIVDPTTGEATEVELFVAVLGASNCTYAEATYTQQGARFIASHVCALAFFGGAPRAIVPDRADHDAAVWVTTMAGKLRNAGKLQRGRTDRTRESVRISPSSGNSSPLNSGFLGSARARAHSDRARDRSTAAPSHRRCSNHRRRHLQEESANTLRSGGLGG